ncbi:stage III sporulation protein AG [Clostridium psychrophilum]|uniref:stage III sporulation protein AG n=1 Tax=Clostridium psychrophilum TaxID=132926 RepID=UPI001C0E2C89|nr:stage III sporulation protein AG [Clostridium psychrophilum]MBU3180151.1 stage III sporulation protein AG [Clostridium psychrophilum]
MNNDNLLSKLTEYIKTKLNGGKDPNKSDKSKKSDKILGNLVLMILVAVVIVLASSFFKTTKATSTTTATSATATDAQKATAAIKNTTTQTSDYETELENNLKITLEGIDGVGKVKLMIYFASGEESVPALNVTDSKSTTVEDDTSGGKRNITQDNSGSTVVMSNNGTNNEPVIVKKYKPVITGVCVVAEGSGEKLTELRIRQAVINLFNLPENKVNVYPMNK